MEWVKERKNPPCEAIQFEGQPCHNLGNLWNALHSTYNAASDRPVDVSILEELPEEPECPWPKFSQLELRQALEACSAPGPDHITWRHLKQILALPECGEIIIALANGCMESGHWPRHFKESMSVIIPKPNKLSYSAPKAFRPIVLLNTLGKLIKKMISNRFQHNMIKYDLADPNQMGGSAPALHRKSGALPHAPVIVFELFTKSGLALEHDKTELFHFTRARTGFDRSLDLGYVPYTGNNPLKPKTYWRYLGFYFYRKLMFQEHIRYYATKALTTVMAMRMLGNSMRGLSPRNKCILYRACVVPIATYGRRLWYFEGARTKGALKTLMSMQCKAACWITGAFCTSPTGGVESLAGLPPICLHLHKLSQRAVFRTATLSDSHPLRQKVVWDAVTETSSKIHTLTEVFSPTAEENTPGERLLDRHQGRVLFDEFDPKGEDALPK
ncbi:hypothetical protein H1R20_g9555, partial [Candolleomyces eurysporus]